MEAARLDGAAIHHLSGSSPVSKPGLAAVGLFQVVGRWNQFREPLLYITNKAKSTIQIALRGGVYASDATAALMWCLPTPAWPL